MGDGGTAFHVDDPDGSTEVDQMLSDGLGSGDFMPGSPLGQQPPRRAPAAAASWMWPDNAESERKLRNLFAMIDRFDTEAEAVAGHAVYTATGDESPSRPGDGGISSTELMHMLVNLGEDVPEDTADEMVDLMDLDGSEELEFSEFHAVLVGRQALKTSSPDATKTKPGGSGLLSGGGRSIREIREKFSLVDEDGGGFLDAEEVGLLGEKMGKSLKRRHLLDVMQVMDPTGSGEVTFDMFKNWLVDSKEHRAWFDFLVLPESVVKAIRRKADDEGILPSLEGLASAEAAEVQWVRSVKASRSNSPLSLTLPCSCSCFFCALP